ncbi:MAG: phosphohistidine phosphatase SixA [Winogradskyella sp.]
MKTIVLVRHGKSSWEYNVEDVKRPLKTKGLEDAKRVSEFFLGSNVIPNKVFSSIAKRADDTCKVFMANEKMLNTNYEAIEDLYDFGGEKVIKFIKQLPNSLESCMIFGHNYAFTSIVNIYGDKFIENLPTCGLVKINFEITNWSELKPGKTDLIIIPKTLR